MVGRSFKAARFLVDVTGQAGVGKGGAREDQVDTQPPVSAERSGTVVPPAEAVGVLLEQAESVGHAQIENLL